VSTVNGGLERPLRIVQTAAFPFPSTQGSQVFVRGMARALGRRGHDVSVVCYAHGEGVVDPDYRVIRTPRVPGYNKLRAGPDWVKPVLDAALALKIAQIPADIVHAHNYEAPIAAAIARRFTGTPLVYSAHNTMGEELPSYFQHPVARRLASGFGQALDRTVPRLASHVVVLNRGAVGTLRGLGCDQVSMVAPGVDIEELAPVRPATLPEGPWVVYAGNPDRYQDLHILMGAMRRLPDVGLLMVSASPLDEWAAQGLPKFKAVQTSDFEVVKSLLMASDVAAIPRTQCSGFPIKLLNTLGMGLPTVIAAGSAQGLAGEIVVPNGDPGAMATAIRTLLARPSHRAELGHRALACVRASCTWDARARELEAIYARVLTR
jgi:1,2-diacylglycerol 3-alpha-glucosyltransferase